MAFSSVPRGVAVSSRVVVSSSSTFDDGVAFSSIPRGVAVSSRVVVSPSLCIVFRVVKVGLFDVATSTLSGCLRTMPTLSTQHW